MNAFIGNNLKVLSLPHFRLSDQAVSYLASPKFKLLQTLILGQLEFNGDDNAQFLKYMNSGGPRGLKTLKIQNVT